MFSVLSIKVEASCLMKTGHSTHRGFETEGLLNTGFAHQRQVLEAFRQQIASIESGSLRPQRVRAWAAVGLHSGAPTIF